MFCAGHVRKLIEMNKKRNIERRRGLGGNQLTLTCPMCRAPVKDFQLMSIKQVENWKIVESQIKKDAEDEIVRLLEPAQKIRAVYRTFKVSLDKRQLALKRVRERAEQLEKEIKEMEEKQEKAQEAFLKQKKDIQSAGIQRRKELRDKQFMSKIKLNF
jgi:chaperonin cofactor prefoldin